MSSFNNLFNRVKALNEAFNPEGPKSLTNTPDAFSGLRSKLKLAGLKSSSRDAMLYIVRVLSRTDIITSEVHDNAIKGQHKDRWVKLFDILKDKSEEINERGDEIVEFMKKDFEVFTSEVGTNRGRQGHERAEAYAAQAENIKNAIDNIEAGKEADEGLEDIMNFVKDTMKDISMMKADDDTAETGPVAATVDGIMANLRKDARDDPDSIPPYVIDDLGEFLYDGPPENPTNKIKRLDQYKSFVKQIYDFSKEDVYYDKPATHFMQSLKTLEDNIAKNVANAEDGEQEHPFECGCGEKWQTKEGKDSCPECNGAHDSEDAEEGSIKAQVLAKIEADAGGKFASAADMAKSAENLYNVYGADGDQERAEIALNFDPVQIILQKYPEGVEALKNDGEFDEGLFDELFDHYSNNGEMPYGTAKGRDGDPEEWIFQKLADLGLIDPTEYVEPREDAEVELDDTFKKLFRKAAQLYNRFNLAPNGGDVTIDEINEFITDRELKRHPAFQKQTAKQYPTFTHPQTNEVFNLRSIVNAIKTQAYQTRWEDRAEKEEAEELTLESVYDDMGFIKAPVMDENGITAPTCSTQQYLTEATEQLIEDKENYTTAYLTEQKESDSYKTAPKEKSLSFKERFQPKTQWQLEELRRYGL